MLVLALPRDVSSPAFTKIKASFTLIKKKVVKVVVNNHLADTGPSLPLNQKAMGSTYICISVIYQQSHQ